MSFTGRNGFFGAMTPYTGSYHPSVYRKYSRGGGSENAAGTLGKAFAYTRPKFAGGGPLSSMMQVRAMYGMREETEQLARMAAAEDARIKAPQVLAANPAGAQAAPNTVGGDPETGALMDSGPYGVPIKHYAPQNSTPTRPLAPTPPSQGQSSFDQGSDYGKALGKAIQGFNKVQDKFTDDVSDPDSDSGYAQGGNVMPRYNKPPHNNANNDPRSGHQAARGSNEYSWGKTSPRFQNFGAEITPHGRNNLTPRINRDAKGRFARGGSAAQTDSEFMRGLHQERKRELARLARGGKAQMTPAWKDRPFQVSQSTKVGNGLKIHALHSGEGLIMNVHLSNVGPHAISFHGAGDYSGAVDQSRMVERQAAHALQAQAHEIKQLRVALLPRVAVE